MTRRSLVVGGGLSGLAAAHALARRGKDVLVLEASEAPGGAVRTQRLGGFLLELGPNTVRPTPELRALIAELSLSNEAVYADRRLPRFIDWNGRLHEAPMSPGALLRTRLLSLSGKLRLMREPFVRTGDASAETLAEFVARRLGREAAERLVEPFVGGVFAGSADRLSARDAFPALTGWEAEHGSLFAGLRAARRTGTASSGGELLSFREGLGTLPHALAARLGASFRPACPVEAVAPGPHAGGWRVTAGGEELEAQRVLVATPASEAGALVAGFAPAAADALAGIPHPPLAVLHLAWPKSALRRPLDGFGHLVAPGGGSKRRILGAIWSSSLFAGRAPESRALLTVFLGGARDPEVVALSDEALVTLAARDLEAEGLIRGDPEPVLVTRWPRAIPQYDRGHAARMAALAEAERRWPGLRFVGNYRGGIAVGDVVREGLAAGEAD